MKRILIACLLVTGVGCKDDKPGPSCPAGTLGCPCDGGSCDGLVCADNECRAAITCSTCADHQRCTPETATTDAACLAECELGWTWNGSACDADCSQDMVDQCGLEHRACVIDAGTPTCADCLVGYLEEGTTCRAVVTCSDCTLELRNCTTPAGEHTDAVCGGCLSGHVEDGGDCRAVYTCMTLPVPCIKGQTCVAATDVADAFCVTCPDCSVGPGRTGVPYPALTSNDKCICETLPGFYYSVGGTEGAFPCDEDQDGWVRVSARQYVESTDPVLAINARCTVEWADRFVLHNETGEVFTVVPSGCDTATDDCANDPDLPVPLYESERNDAQAQLAIDGDAPPYQTAAVPNEGRRLLAKELNSLTKACVAVNADYNDNAVPDVREWARPGVGAQVSVSADLAVYTRYSYFLAMHRGWFAADAGETPPTLHGAYHIREKDRTPTGADAFALRYDPAESNFWQDCPRARDAWYSTEHPPIGLDFGSVSGPSDRSDTWTGMMHHSQFKCVQVASTMPTVPADEPHIQTLAAVAAQGWDLNDCQATDPGSSYPPVSGTNPSDPEIACALIPTLTSLPQVLWAAVRIGSIESYERGCVVQCEGQPYLCPGGADPCWWMCGDFAGSESNELSDAGSGWTLRGEVPAPGLDEDVENPMTGGGWTVRSQP